MRGIIFTFSYCCCIKASCYICSSNICFINLGVLKFKSLYLVSPTHVKTRSHTHSPPKIKKGFCVIMWVKIIFDWSLVHNIVTFCLYFFCLNSVLSGRRMFGMLVHSCLDYLFPTFHLWSLFVFVREATFLKSLSYKKYPCVFFLQPSSHSTVLTGEFNSFAVKVFIGE